MHDSKLYHSILGIQTPWEASEVVFERPGTGEPLDIRHFVTLAAGLNHKGPPYVFMSLLSR